MGSTKTTERKSHKSSKKKGSSSSKKAVLAKRHQRDRHGKGEITEFRNGTLQNIARRAGVITTRDQGTLYDILRKYVGSTLEKLVVDSVIFAQSSTKRKTVRAVDVLQAAQHNNMPIHGYGLRDPYKKVSKKVYKRGNKQGEETPVESASA